MHRTANLVINRESHVWALHDGILYDTALEPIARPHVLRIVEIRPSGGVVMEGSDVARREEQIKNIAHCPLPILDTNMYPERYFRGPSLHCFVCGTRHRSAKMVICDKYNAGCHIW